MFRAFTDALDKHKNDIQGSVNRLLKWQLNVLRVTLEGRTITYRASNGLSNFDLMLTLFPSGRLSYSAENLIDVRVHKDSLVQGAAPARAHTRSHWRIIKRK